MDKLIGVYRITNIKNDKIYIGESEDIPRRWVEHITELVSNEHCNYKLQEDFNKYGIKNFQFDVIESIIFNKVNKFKCKMTLLCREHYYINKYNSINKGYNIVDSLYDVINNKKDIFLRDKIQSQETYFSIKTFLKENPNLYKEPEEMKCNNITTKQKECIGDNKSTKDILIKQKKEKKESIQLNENEIRISNLYHNMLDNKLLDYISPQINLELFKSILQYNKLLYYDAGFKITKFSLDNNLLRYNDEQVKQTNNIIIVSKSGIDLIHKIFNENNIKQITLDIIDSFKGTTVERNNYLPYIDYFKE